MMKTNEVWWSLSWTSHGHHCSLDWIYWIITHVYPLLRFLVVHFQPPQVRVLSWPKTTITGKYINFVFVLDTFIVETHKFYVIILYRYFTWLNKLPITSVIHIVNMAVCLPPTQIIPNILYFTNGSCKTAFEYSYMHEDYIPFRMDSKSLAHQKKVDIKVRNQEKMFSSNIQTMMKTRTRKLMQFLLTFDYTSWSFSTYTQVSHIVGAL